MCPFKDISVIPESCDKIVDFFIIGSSSPNCSHSKMVLSLSVANSSAEIQSVTDQPTDQPTNQQQMNLGRTLIFEMRVEQYETLEIYWSDRIELCA